MHGFKDKEILDTQLIHNVIDELATIDYQGLVLFSIYNEPLCDSRFYDLCKYTKEKCPNCKIFLNTNGFYLNGKTIQKIEAVGVDYVYISAYSPSEYERFKKLKTNLAVSISPMILDDRLDIYSRQQTCCKSPCESPYFDLNINSKGDVVLCCLDYKSSITFGNLKNQSLTEIVNSSKMFSAYEKLSKSDRCFDICKRCNWSRM